MRALTNKIGLLRLVYLLTVVIFGLGDVAKDGFHLSRAAAATIRASDFRIEGGNENTRLILNLPSKTRYRILTLSDPYRVAIDMSDVQFDRPVRVGRKGRGLISVYRYGRLSDRISRILLYVTAPVNVKPVIANVSSGGQKADLVVELVPTDRIAYLAAKTYLGRPSRQGRAAGGADDTKPVIIVDPGHGGKEPGAVGAGGAIEKNVVLAFAMTLHEKLRKSGKFLPQLTRTDDRTMTLEMRWRFVHLHKALSGAPMLFISLHADSVPGGYSRATRGASVYVYSDEPSNQEAQALAAQENSGDGKGGQAVLGNDVVTPASILVERGNTKAESMRFAQALIHSLQETTRIRRTRPLNADFSVINLSGMPAVLLELAFLSNRADEKLLVSDEWRESAADAVVKAIEIFFAKSHSPGTTKISADHEGKAQSR